MDSSDFFTIIWNKKDRQEEAPGISIYGAKFPVENIKLINSKSIVDGWQGAIDCNISIFQRDEYTTLYIDILFIELPMSMFWRKNLEVVMMLVCEAGSKFAYGENLLCGPSPLIFFKGSFEAVYTCYTPQKGFLCNSGYEEDVVLLDDIQLSELGLILNS